MTTVLLFNSDILIQSKCNERDARHSTDLRYDSNMVIGLRYVEVHDFDDQIFPSLVVKDFVAN